MCAHCWRFVFAAVFLGSWLNPWTPGAISVALPWLLAGTAVGIALWATPAMEFKPQLTQGIAMAGLVSAGMGLLQYAQVSDELAPWVNASPGGDVYANLRQRNQLASLLVMGVFALALMRPRWTDPSIKSSLSAWLSRLVSTLLLGMVLCLAATGSRTGGLQLVCLVGLAVTLRTQLPAGTLGWLLRALVLYGVCVLILPSLSAFLELPQAGLLGRLDQDNAFSRLALWSNTLELIAQKPLLGHGWRSLAYMHYSTEFSGERFMEMLDNAHNLPLHLAVELGLPVAVGFCGIVGWLIWKGRPWAEMRWDRQLAWGCLMVIGIHSMLEYPLWYGPFFLTALLCVWILCGDLWRNWLMAGTKSARNAITLGARGLGVALLAFTAFAAFDYHRVSQIYLQPEDRSSWYKADALGAAQRSVLFKSHAKFAELVITPLSSASAPRVFELSSELIFWSPEPRVIEKLIESSVMLGADDVAAFHLKRYARAYPEAYAQWKARSK